MATGYITIKGAEFQKWIDSEFQLVKRFVTPPQHQNPTENVNQAEVKEPTDKAPKQNLIPQKPATKDEIDQLWEENKTLKTALHTLEQSIKTKNCNCQNELTQETIEKLFSDKLQSIESSYDQKLFTIRSTLEKEFRDELKEGKKVITQKVNKLHDDVIYIRRENEDGYNGLFYKVTSVEKKLVQKSECPGTKCASLESNVIDDQSEIETPIGEQTDDELSDDEQTDDELSPIEVKLDAMAEKLDLHVAKMNNFVNEMITATPPTNHQQPLAATNTIPNNPTSVTNDSSDPTPQATCQSS